MEEKTYKVSKDNQIKIVTQVELPKALSCGWKIVKNPNTENINTFIKK